MMLGKNDVKSVDDIFSQFEKATPFAKALGLKPSTASEMRRRRSIPVRYWPKLVKIARRRGINLDYNTLVSIHTREVK